MAGTGRRNNHRVGSYLVTDDLTGYTEYVENVHRDWRGLMINNKYPEPRNPQEFIRVGSDPKALTNVRPPAIDDVYVSAISTKVGSSDVDTGTDMISHLFVKIVK